MTDHLVDVEALLEEAYTKKDRSQKKNDKDNYKRRKSRGSQSPSRNKYRDTDRKNRSPRRDSHSRDYNRHRRDSPDRHRNDKSRRARTPSPPSNMLPQNEIEPLSVEECDARTIFMRQLPRGAGQKDISEFFRPAGKIRDIRMITDRNSHRPKGIAYVEFANIDSVTHAIRMSGEKILGRPVVIQATMAEKNRAAMEAAALAKQYGPTKLYVGNLHPDVTEAMLRAIFEPFGSIEYIQLQYDSVTGNSKGFGFVHFKNPDHSRYAAEKLNGFEMADRALKVCQVNEKADISFMVHGDLNRRSGVRAITNSAPAGSVSSSIQASSRPDPPSSCIVISNAFDSFTEQGSTWLKEIEKDITKQVQGCGSLMHKFVDRNSVEGNIYMRFAKPEDAVMAAGRLKGRMFQGRVIKASIFPQFTYQTMFPNS